MRSRSQPDDALRCSFCSKPQKEGGKLISSPSDHPRAYICDECIAVCQSIVEDDRSSREAAIPEPPASPHPLLDHPLASELMERVVLWIRKESLGVEAAEELAQVRETASKMTCGA